MNILEQLSSQAEQVEVVEVQGENTSVGFEANRLKSSQVEETKGIALRVVKDGRLGFAASSDMSAMDKLVDNLLESAAHGDEIPIVFPAPQPAADVTVFDSGISEMPIPRLVEIGREVIDVILQVEPEAQVNLALGTWDSASGTRQPGRDGDLFRALALFDFYRGLQGSGR